MCVGGVEVASPELTPLPEIDKPEGDNNVRGAPSETEGVLTIVVEIRDVNHGDRDVYQAGVEVGEAMSRWRWPERMRRPCTPPLKPFLAVAVSRATTRRRKSSAAAETGQQAEHTCDCDRGYRSLFVQTAEGTRARAPAVEAQTPIKEL